MQYLFVKISIEKLRERTNVVIMLISDHTNTKCIIIKRHRHRDQHNRMTCLYNAACIQSANPVDSSHPKPANASIMNPILYYFPYSPPSRCVLLLAQIIGIVFDAKVIDITKGEQMTESFLQVIYLDVHVIIWRPTDRIRSALIRRALHFFHPDESATYGTDACRRHLDVVREPCYHDLFDR